MDYTAALQACLEVLRRGGILLYPTDTVWGIGCDATDPAAVARIFALKRRADSKSLVLLAADLDMVARYVRAVPEMAIQLVEVNDKPMTLVYPDALRGEGPAPDGTQPRAQKHLLAWNVVAEDGSVGMRIPLQGFCRELVRRLGHPLVSTSANLSGEPTPKSFREISPAIREGVDACAPESLESGATGAASQIIKIGLDGTVKIIRM